MKVSYEKLREATDIALKELRRQGVQGLPEKPGKDISEGVWWAHPLVWLMLGMLSVCTVFLLPQEPPITPVRFEGDMLPIGGMTDLDQALIWVLIPSFLGIIFFGYVLSGFLSASSALQFIGTILIGLPWLGRRLVRIAKLADHSWDVVRKRFMLQLCLVLGVQLCFHALVFYRIGSVYHAVSFDGVRQVAWPLSHKVYSWDELVEIRVLCSRKLKDGNLFYGLIFPDAEFNLIRKDRKGLEILNGIDQALLAEGVPKRRYTEEEARFCASRWSNEEERPLLEEIFKR